MSSRSRPRASSTRMIDGKKCEPIERLVCDVPQDYVGAVIEKLGSRKGDLAEMTPIGSRMKLEFLIPARGLFGYRNEFLTDTKGEGIMACVFDSYAPYKGELAAPQHRLSRRVRDRRALSPTASSMRRSAACCSSARASMCTRAWSSASPPSRRTSRSTCARRSS